MQHVNPTKKTHGMFVLNADAETVNLRGETSLNVKPREGVLQDLEVHLYITKDDKKLHHWRS